MNGSVITFKILIFQKLKFSRGWSLFESEQDLKTYDEWLDDETEPGTKYLDFGISAKNNLLHMDLGGTKTSYKLDARSIFEWPYTIFSESFHTFEDGPPYTGTPITEIEFYSKIEKMLNILTRTNKIPFEEYNVK